VSPQAQTVALPKRWPLVNNINSRNQEFTKDARLINAYAEKDRTTGEYQVEKRPGFAATPVIAGVARGQGIFTQPFISYSGSAPWTEGLYQTVVVNGNQAYYIATDNTGVSHAPVLLGTADINLSAVGSPQKAQFLGLPALGGYNATILFGGGQPFSTSRPNGPDAYYVESGVGGAPGFFGALIPGTDNFPDNTVPGFVSLNGYTYVMDVTGVIWQTATQNQIAFWSSTAYVGAQSESDLAVQLAKQLVYVVAIKQWSTQFFYDASNTTGSSLSPVPGAIFNFGCVSSDTFADLDGILFWATQSKAGTYEIVQVENLQYKVISTPAVERQLDLGGNATWYSVAYQHAGHRFYVLTNVTNNVTMVYDIGEQLWYLWTDYQGNYYPVIARCSSPDGDEWHQLGSNGNVYEMDGDYVYPNDYGNLVPVDIYTPNFDAGTDRGKHLNMMYFNADQAPGSVLFARCSDDDYQTWTNFRKVDLSKRMPRSLDNCGSFVRRAYHFRHLANAPLRIRSVGLQLDLCTL
jgi:hypothetical protein